MLPLASRLSTLVLVVAGMIQAPLDVRAGASGAVVSTPAPALTRLFAPPAAPRGSCEVSMTAAPIEEVVAAMRAMPGADPAGWHIRSAGLTDAFGTEGPYDRARLARLIGGGRIRMARGSVTADGETTGYTLVTPVPDPAFETLRSGTMIVAVRVQRMLTAVTSPQH